MHRPLRSGPGSRRAFLGTVGLAASAAGIIGTGDLLLPTSAEAQSCSPPGAGTPVPWRRDCRPVRPRRPASTLNASEIQKLKDAYKAMRDLAVSDPTDPRGIVHQANVHCWNCGQSTQIHGSWSFFAWHRAELYFHERILGRLIKDENFRLPVLGLGRVEPPHAAGRLHEPERRDQPAVQCDADQEPDRPDPGRLGRRRRHRRHPHARDLRRVRRHGDGTGIA